MSVATMLTQSLNVQHPIIQAPLAGGGDTPELVGAVSNAGALGFIGAAYLTPEQIIATASAVRRVTSRPFGINLFAPLSPKGAQKDSKLTLERLAPYFADLGLPSPSLPKSTGSSFEDQLAAALELARPYSVSLSGCCPRRPCKPLRPARCF